ncbi:MAG: GNAT family N-acetyltransferase [Anaerolineae bacterium]|nr:GNAT family N-acetyltransferase [Anaerolineae bacterium]
MDEIIEELTADRVAWVASEFAQLGWPKPPNYFADCFAQQEAGELVFLLARGGEALHGYLKVVWTTDYPPFREQGIPEIQDLNVMPPFRRQGVASRLMDEAERRIAARSAIAGIGVGLHPGYGPAQRMYVLRGYVPDARPLTYGDTFVVEGQTVKLDDELILHLTKSLRKD